MTINGTACGLKSVSQGHVQFVVPPAIASSVAGTVYPFVINNNGTQMKAYLTIVPTRPDIFRLDGVVAPLGRAKLFNVTNIVHTSEPFGVRTILIKGGIFVPTILRVYMTGIANVSTTSSISVRIHDTTINGTGITSIPVIVEPGVYTFDFTLPPGLDAAGDQPIVVTVTADSVNFDSRVDDTTSRLFIL